MTSLEYLIAIALEGLIISSIGLIVYSTGFRYFKSLDHQFDSKETAQITVVAFLIGAGILGDPLQIILRDSLSNFEIIQQLGILIISSRAVVNWMVDNWRHDDNYSGYMYFGGLVLILFPLF